MPIRNCEACGAHGAAQYCRLRENVSLFVVRWERTLEGYFCFSCCSTKFLLYEFKTLFFTWFGIIGILLGPFFLLGNLLSFGTACVNFMIEKIKGEKPTHF